MRRVSSLFSLALLVCLLLAGLTLADLHAEAEPNDTPEQANELWARDEMQGEVHPLGDVDYYRIAGMGENWGIVVQRRLELPTDDN